jgi:hypothetical protein
MTWMLMGIDARQVAECFANRREVEAIMEHKAIDVHD